MNSFIGLGGGGIQYKGVRGSSIKQDFDKGGGERGIGYK